MALQNTVFLHCNRSYRRVAILLSYLGTGQGDCTIPFLATLRRSTLVWFVTVVHDVPDRSISGAGLR